MVNTTSPFLTDIPQVCADIRARGHHSMVVSMSPDFYARLLLRFGFDEVVASRFPEPPFASPVVAEDILTPHDKVGIVEEARRRRGVDLERCVAYGDSMSDAPLFRHLTNTVAVNGDGHIADLASARYTGTSLWDAYSTARGILTPTCP
ncbi:haloacid dehalogenase-like hydrolase [Nocardiopsis sp. EMB25]|uniref:HAD family hydrolase n=1 Tax=Nocardiopsis sp. EMB25 TaxID=2835867 RepID=UPI0022845C0A|nr:haloacid dehalogenase-like hydrolase [Nocardiopsis sp. EMB25]MCY9784352.1 haloacid dehalogenase-like hydrolase [Nocardiopsis sp. EMB25]